MGRRRSAKAIAVDTALREVVQQMLEADETVTARALARRVKLGAASSVTRDPVRRALLAAVVAEQTKRREWVRRSRKQSTADLVNSLAAGEEKISTLNRQVQLLTASHLAMIRAVGELGGASAWAQFFVGYEASMVELRALGALPPGSFPPSAEQLPPNTPLLRLGPARSPGSGRSPGRRRGKPRRTE